MSYIIWKLYYLKSVLISVLNLVSKPSKSAPSRFYDRAHLKILPTLSEVILTHLFKTCHEDEYDKINELFNLKYGLLFSTNPELLLMNKVKKKKKKRGPGKPSWTIMGTLIYNSTNCFLSLQCLKVTVQKYSLIT